MMTRFPKIIIKSLILQALLAIPVSSIFAQSEVQGKVIDIYGNPIVNAEISIENQPTVITNEAGRYTANVQIGDIINVAKTGYKPGNIEYSGKGFPVVALEKDNYQSTESIAFGTEKNSIRTSAISTIRGDDLSWFPTQVLTSGLAGMLSGLTVMQTSGEPGENLPQMLIRGKSTLGNNDFLIYVDGFEADADQLIASEIESISVLKDAAALAPFGMRGANGVLWVTTKKGTVSPLSVGFESRFGISQAIQMPSFLDATGYASLYNEAYSNDAGAWSPVYSNEELNKYQSGEDPVFYPNIDWFGENLKNLAPYTENHISLQGGSQLVKYYLLLGYRFSDKLYKERESDEFPSLRNTGQSQRYNFRSNIDLTINDIFSSSLRIGGSLLDNTEPALNNMFSLLERYPPNIYPVTNPNGSWGGSSIFPDNLVAGIQDMGARSTHQRYLQTGVLLKEDLNKFVPGLSFSQEIDLSSWFTNNYNQLRTAATFQPYQAADSIGYIQWGFDTPFNISDGGRNQWTRINVALSGFYNRTFGNTILSAMLTYRQDKLTSSSETIPFVHSGLSGWLKLDFNNTFHTGLTMAYTGSQNFPKGKRYGFFPAVSAGWTISNSAFLANNSWIDFLKIRGSAGMLGNEGTDRFGYITYFPRGSNVIFGASGIETQATLYEDRLGNPDFTWEKSMNYNIGLDSRFFNKKLDLSIDYFQEKRSDILTKRSRRLPAVIGAELPIENVGEVSNRGLELDVMFSDNIGAFEYHFGGMMSYAKSKIEYLDELYSEEYLYRTGNPVGQLFGLESLGFFQSETEINDPATPIHTFSKVQPGDIRYADQNKDGRITEDDEIPIGKTVSPEVNYSFSMGARFKRFDIEVFLFGTANRSVIFQGNAFFAFQNNTQVPAIAEGRWAYYPNEGIDTRETATYPRLSTFYNENNYRNSTFWTHTGSFLSLRNLEIGYSFPIKNSKNPFVKNVRLYASGINLLTWDKLEHYNAEVLTGYPLMKSYHIGLKMNL